MSGVQETHDAGMAPATRMVVPARAKQASPLAGPKLLDRLREALRSRHYSRRTEEAYFHWVKRFIYHVLNRGPPGTRSTMDGL